MNKLIGVLLIAGLCSNAVLFAPRGTKPTTPQQDFVTFLGAKGGYFGADLSKLKDPCELLDLFAGAKGEKGLIALGLGLMTQGKDLTPAAQDGIKMALDVINNELADLGARLLKC